MLACPQLPFDIITSMQAANITGILSAEVVCDGGSLNCKSLANTDVVTRGKTGKCVVGEFTGRQVLAALTDIFISRFFWIK
jgi:hypothetical protein